MPTTWAHLIFGQEVLQRLSHQDLIHESHLRNVFNLGCQGPDLLFYRNFQPWKRNKDMFQLGNAIHNQFCGLLLMDMIRKVKGYPLNDPVVIYVLGFLTHHILDRNMHPYVIYKSGYEPWNHTRFEITLDTLVVQDRLGLETWKTPVWKEVYVGEEAPERIVSLLSESISSYFPDLVRHYDSSEWNKAYQDMINAHRVYFHDPSGIKRLLTFGKIEPMIYKRNVPPNDYLNIAHKIWNHPADPDEKYNYSFWDLWDIALDEATAILQQVINSVSGKAQDHAEPDYKEIIQLIGNRSYESGKSCNLKLDMQYVQPIY